MGKICTNINPSKFDKRIDIEQASINEDSVGGQTKSWSVFASGMWASIDPVKAYERFQSQKMETPISHNMVMRYIPGVTNSMRINYLGRIFNIVEVINVEEEDVYLKIKAVEGTAT